MSSYRRNDSEQQPDADDNDNDNDNDNQTMRMNLNIEKTVNLNLSNANDEVRRPTLIIPPIQNTWPPVEKTENLDLPITDPDANEGGNDVPPDVAMLQKLKEDLQRVPKDEGLDKFIDVPVEGFGAALLAGYGWSEGMAIGKK